MKSSPRGEGRAPGLPCLGSERRAPLTFFEPCSGVELRPGSWPARGQRRSRSALNLRFRVSRLGGARRVLSGFRRDFLVIANFLRDGPRPVGAPRLARWPIYSPIGFLGLSATRARAHSRVDAGRLAIWDRFDAACRTYLVRNAAFIYSFVRLQKPHLGLGLGSDPRFSLLQALFGRPMRKKETRRRIGFSRKPVLAKKPQLVSARVSTRRC